MNHEMRMDEIGRRLERAVAADLHSKVTSSGAGWRSRLASHRTRVLGGLAVFAAIAAPGVAWAAGVFTSPSQEAASLPATSTIFDRTSPTCTVVKDNAEYRCTLKESPKALPALNLTNQQEMQLFSMSREQTREFPQAATGTNLKRYTAFVGEVRQWRADHDGPLLRQWGFSDSEIGQWVDAMRDPETATDLRVGRFQGHVIDTTDADHKVNGACRASDPAGREWRCYLGQAAVQAGLIFQDVLGGQMFRGPVDDL